MRRRADPGAGLTPSSWEETSSPNFHARHDAGDADDVVGVLELLENTRERLAEAFPVTPGEVAVVVHGSRAQLYAAQPELPLVARMTSPEARRYLTGWPSKRELHMLAPRHLRSRSSKVPGSREMAMLAPAALYTQLVVGANNPSLPPPFRPMALTRMMRSAWLWAGAGQWFSGQTAYARPAIARRLHEGSEPSFPPSIRDSLLLGGSVLDLLAAESDATAVVRLVTEPSSDGSTRALVRAFGGQSLVQLGGEWRAHLARMAGQQPG